MQIPKEAVILMRGIGMGIIYWCAGVMGLFGIACLCSKRLRDWAEGMQTEPKQQKPWLTYQWRPHDE